jgi:tetratricopeptide (TPR) repeat protein
MKSRSRWIAGVSFLLLALIPGHAQSSDVELQLGIESYKNSRLEQAAFHFKKATELDPSNITARIFLATTYSSLFIPGVDIADNIALAEKAIEQYEVVLNSDAPNEPKLSATKGIAYLYLNMKKFDDAKDYYQKASALDPADPEPYYSIGVIDWTKCYQPRMEARVKLGMKAEENLSRKIPAQREVCEALRIGNWSLIEDGIDNFTHAIEHRPDYDDAMAYMNLMYREKADLECENPAARDEDLKTADKWVDNAIAVKKLKAAKANRVIFPTEPNPQ